MSKLLSEEEKKSIIHLVKNADVNDEDSVFDLGKALRDYGFMLMARVIKN